MAAIQAVLTGDLVASTEATPGIVDRSMGILAAAAAEIAAWPVGENSYVGNTRFTRYRGDGWQILVSVGAFGLRAALLTYARLAGDATLLPTRVAVGLATVDDVPGADLSDAHGAAFALSGHALDQMDRSTRLKIAGHRVSPLLAAFLGLLDDRVAAWTPEQAQAIALVLPPHAPTQTTIARQLGISPQALSYRLTGARWPTIRRILHEWERPQPPREEQT